MPPDTRVTWRLLIEAAPADGATNMAVDQALAEAVAAGGPPTIRLYRWAPPTLSFGRNQPARGLYDGTAARRRGIAFVRRPTGGQAVLHDDELTYAVVAPVSVIGKPRAAYARINGALVEGLRQLGVAARLADARAAVADGAGTEGRGWSVACFRRPERGEVVVSGRKLVGSAQRVESRTVLQHGSILVGGSQAAAEELLVAGTVAGVVGDGDAAWTTVERELGRRPDRESLETAVVSGFEEVLGTRLARSTLRAAECRAVEELRQRYASDSWTWRR